MNSITTYCSLLVLLPLAFPTELPAQASHAPVLDNAGDVRREMFEAYTVEMRRLGLTGRATLQMTVRADGRPSDISIIESSDVEVLDEAAREVAEEMRFEPARASGEKIEQTIRLPLEFRSQCGTPPDIRFRPDMPDLVDGLSAAQIDAHFEQGPAAVLLSVTIDTQGRPTDVEIMESSGLADSDSLAVRAAYATRFVPVRWEERPVRARFRLLMLPRLDVPPVPQMVCPNPSHPVVTNRRFLVRSAQMIGRGITDKWNAPVVKQAAATLWVRPDGRVGRVYLTQSTCWEELDDYLLSIWSAAEFEPAACDGEPVGSYATLPLVFGFRD